MINVPPSVVVDGRHVPIKVVNNKGLAAYDWIHDEIIISWKVIEYADQPLFDYLIEHEMGHAKIQLPNRFQLLHDINEYATRPRWVVKALVKCQIMQHPKITGESAIFMVAYYVSLQFLCYFMLMARPLCRRKANTGAPNGQP